MIKEKDKGEGQIFLLFWKQNYTDEWFYKEVTENTKKRD